jgi:N-acetylglucosaminyl-diphospho-decaprenol L-rhamnosyltransferase
MELLSPPSVRLWVVIVNYQTASLTLDGLASLVAEYQRGLEMRVVVVDNASGDDSLAVLQQGLTALQNPVWIQVEAMPKNGGFAYGNNVVLRQAMAANSPPDYILLLNPDAAVREGAIAPLIQFLDDHPKVGLVGSRLEDPDGTPQTSAFRFPSIWSELDHGLRLGVVSRLIQHRRLAMPLVMEPCLSDRCCPRQDYLTKIIFYILKRWISAIALSRRGGNAGMSPKVGWCIWWGKVQA